MAHQFAVDIVYAGRSVLRQGRRSAFSLTAIAFGVAALILASGFIEWNFVHYREEMIRTQLGHIRIHRAGYTKEGLSNPFAFLLPETSPDLEALKSIRHVTGVAPRLALSGLVSRGDTTLPFIAEGVAPELEREMSRALVMIAGEHLTEGSGNRVIVGQGLASSLGVGVGDQLVLMVNPPNGGINAIEARVEGLFTTTSKAYDDTAIRLPIQLARQLLRVHGSHAWILILDETSRTRDVLSDVQSRLPIDTLEAVAWWTLSDFYNKSAALFSKQVNVMRAIIGLLIVLAISNAMMMNVLERTAEIGTTMALGLRRRDVLRRFLAEAAVLGGIGAAIGIALGYLLGYAISWVGIPVPPPPGMARSYIGRILVTPDLAAGAAILAIATTLIAAIYPAWKASRLRIVDALRHNRA